ncbi:MAG TPA: DUF5591 domain-containing protein, partial [Candidatus Lokiarchaeia archaeon]|nr:DUF5591 domain-containing protein [Candidatus Lokiarchaeia archaeon]
FLRNWNIIQNRLPSDIFYIAWGQISPFFAPIIAYLGFDGFAGFGCTTLASNGKIATPYGGVVPEIDQTVGENIGDIRQQNWETLNGIAREIRGREEYGMLRDFVELSTHFENPIAAMLRNFDAMNEDNPPAGTRSNKSSSLQCTSVEAYSRPELVLYRQRLLQCYATPAYKKVIVILPCAATKPYSNSPSHRKIRNAIQRGAKSMSKAVEELIVTSPLGVVPRALEEIYPAAFYDVPVTGYWDETEVNISVHMLSAILAQSPSDVPVIALAEGGYLTVCQQVKEQVPQPFTIFTPAPKLLSYDVLTEFSSRIADVLAEYDIVNMANTPPAKNEQYSAIADFQFGIGAGHVLFSSPLKVQSPPQGPTRIIDRSTRQIIATVQPSGLLRPRLDGVNRLVMGNLPALGKIYFTGDALSGSSLFAAGIDGVEGDIRPGDFIVILNRTTGKILATAEAVVDGNTMLRLRHGAVARILEKAKGGS